MEEDVHSQSEAKAESSKSKQRPVVVGIGASAGGLSALKKFFENIPPDTGLTFVVVVHLSPEHKSMLVDLLQPHVRFPVQQVTETTLLERDNVYVIPPNANLSAIDTHLRLSKLEEQRRERAPIDHFFRTLANTHDGHAVGVVLTGTGSDGTLGIKDIKAKGGLIIVQDPNEAEYDGMPQSAIGTGLVDRVLPVAEIPEAIRRYDRTEPRVTVESLEQEDAGTAERILLPKVLGLLRARTDRDFSRYKRSTILRRIARRMQLNYMEDLEAYIERIREHPEEARALADDLLITVTSFFRDKDVFERLENDVILKLFHNKGPQDSIRVWSVGCATGEEAYSIAILLFEEASRRESAPQIQIFASDLHKRSLDKAREGYYPEDIETDVGTGRLQRFFVQENGGYRIQKEVRDLVVFAPHNLLADPPFSRLDLISCRNLLIYLDRDVQHDVIELFHYALQPEGYLLLGSAETIDNSDLFRTEDKKLCMYRKRNVPAPEPRLPVFPLTRGRFFTGARPPRAEQALETAAYGALHQLMVEQYAPPSLLVNSENKLVHLSEHAGRYLVHPGGELTTNVLKLVREELRMELRTLAQSAREKREAFDSKPIPVRFNGHTRPVVLHVRPALQADQDGFVLVIFDEREARAAGQPPPPSDPSQWSDAAAERIRELELEIAEARQRLQEVIEEHETSQEEMKASNEEMQSTNEELRSTLEELETSKEELQSINEELQTVNQENRHKVEELSQLSSDLQNLLSATDIATLFLDRELRILRFTSKLGDLFNIRMSDRGRPLSDLTHKLGYPELGNDARTVLNRLTPAEREVQDSTGHWYLTRVLPYRSTDDRIEGVVITFVDISSRKNADMALRASQERFRRALEIGTVGVVFFEPDGRIKRANEAFLRLSGYTLADVESGRLRWDSLTPPEWLPHTQRAMEEYQAKGSFEPYEKEYLRKDGSRWYGLSAATKLDENEGAEFIIDVSDRKRAEQALEARDREFNAVINLSPDLLWNLDPEGNATWYNARWFAYTGQTSGTSNESSWVEAIHPDDREKCRRSVTEAMERSGRSKHEVRIRRSDGQYRWFLFQAHSPNSDSALRLSSYITAFDIHEEYAAIEALRRSVAEKDALLKEVHHRVKNNLQVITSLLNLQARRIQDENALAVFDEARNRVQSIASIHEALYHTDTFAEVELVELARSVVPQVVRLYGAQDRIGVQIIGDGASLDLQRAVPFGLLLNELVSNVCKHAFPSGKKGSLIVSLGQTDHQIVLNVRDTGVGLPKGFKNSGASTVGIYLVNSLAQQLQATVDFETGQGTNVQVRMPLNAAAEAEEER